MRRYKLADYLTPTQKARAVAVKYERIETGTWAAVPEGQCPLGVALGLSIWPKPWLVAALVDGPRAEIERAAEAFTRAWDRGKIPPDQLAAALGVEA